jgi:hypothetical protein
VSISTISVGATDGSFKMDDEVTRVERGNLLMIANPNYQTLVDSYGHHEGVSMEDKDTNPFYQYIASWLLARMQLSRQHNHPTLVSQENR